MKVYIGTRLQDSYYSLVFANEEEKLCFIDTEELSMSIKNTAELHLAMNGERLEDTLKIVPELKYIPPISAFSFLVYYPSTVNKMIYYVHGDINKEKKVSVFEIEEMHNTLYVRYKQDRAEEIEQISSCVSNKEYMLSSLGAGTMSVFAPGLIDKLAITPELLEDSLFAFTINASIAKELYPMFVEQERVPLNDILLYFIGYLIAIVGRLGVKVPHTAEPEITSAVSGKLMPVAVKEAIQRAAKAFNNLDDIGDKVKRHIDEVVERINKERNRGTMYI